MNLYTTLFLIFLTLKLTDLIHWGWLAVFSPLIFPILIIIFLSTFMSKEELDKKRQEYLKKYKK